MFALLTMAKHRFFLPPLFYWCHHDEEVGHIKCGHDHDDANKNDVDEEEHRER